MEIKSEIKKILSIIIAIVILFIIINVLLLKFVLTTNNKIEHNYYSQHEYCTPNITINMLSQNSIVYIQQLNKFIKQRCPKPFINKSNILAYYFYMAGLINNVNPSLLIEIMLIESNCNIYAINDKSGAYGLMQIHPVHNNFLYQNDFENIMKGAQILSDCFDIYKSIEGALECYGKGNFDKEDIKYIGTLKLSDKYKNNFSFNYQ